jgi:hypothetical protein
MFACNLPCKSSPEIFQKKMFYSNECCLSTLYYTTVVDEKFLEKSMKLELMFIQMAVTYYYPHCFNENV